MSGLPNSKHKPDSPQINLQMRQVRRHFTARLGVFGLIFAVPSCRFGYEVLEQLKTSGPEDEPSNPPGDGGSSPLGGTTGDGDVSLGGDGSSAGGTGSGGLDPASSGGASLGSAGDSGLGGSAGAPYMGPLPDPEPPSILSAGQSHTCGISTSGDLFCWGANNSSALGGFVGSESSLPVPVAGEGALGGFVGVAAGLDSTCALRDDGSVWCWGSNIEGQLGQGDTTDRAEPVQVPLDAPAQTLTLNHKVACIIDENHALYCWGWNWEGQMAQGDTPASPVDSTRPILIPSAIPWADVSAGDGHVCAVRADGELYCWGRNSNGELGRDSPIQLRTLTRVGSDNNWKLVRAAQNQTCGIRDDKSLWCWGSGNGGQLGITPPEVRKTPTRVGLDSDWANVEPQVLHTCALREDKSLWCWGRREEGQSAQSYDANPILSPLSVDPNFDWDLMTSGRFHTCGARAGALYCTGENIDGRLGNGSLTRSYGFVPVGAF